MMLETDNLRRKMAPPLRFYRKLFSRYVGDSKTRGSDFPSDQRRQRCSRSGFPEHKDNADILEGCW